MIKVEELPNVNTNFSAETNINFPFLSDWETLLRNMPKIKLNQLQDYSLMRRFDTKYLVPENELLNIIHSISSSYSVLEVNNIRLNQYLTTYYDSSDFLFYRQHHNGTRNRCKVRTRTYLSSDKTFLEIKRKGLNNQSLKERIAIKVPGLINSPSVDQFIDQYCPIPEELLEEKLKNNFMRFTLVNRSCIERVTIDLGLTFINEYEKVVLPGVAVVEIKQEEIHTKTALVKALHETHHNPQGFSKYCIGISLLEKQVKHNRFKKNLLQLGKLVSEGNYYYGIA